MSFNLLICFNDTLTREIKKKCYVIEVENMYEIDSLCFETRELTLNTGKKTEIKC